MTWVLNTSLSRFASLFFLAISVAFEIQSNLVIASASYFNDGRSLCRNCKPERNDIGSGISVRLPFVTLAPTLSNVMQKLEKNNKYHANNLENNEEEISAFAHMFDDMDARPLWLTVMDMNIANIALKPVMDDLCYMHALTKSVNMTATEAQWVENAIKDARKAKLYLEETPKTLSDTYMLTAADAKKFISVLRIVVDGVKEENRWMEKSYLSGHKAKCPKWYKLP